MKVTTTKIKQMIAEEQAKYKDILDKALKKFKIDSVSDFTSYRDHDKLVELIRYLDDQFTGDVDDQDQPVYKKDRWGYKDKGSKPELMHTIDLTNGELPIILKKAAKLKAVPAKLKDYKVVNEEFKLKKYKYSHLNENTTDPNAQGVETVIKKVKYNKMDDKEGKWQDVKNIWPDVEKERLAKEREAKKNLKEGTKYGSFYSLFPEKKYHAVIIGDFALEAFSYNDEEEFNIEQSEWHPSVKVLYNGDDFKTAKEIYDKNVENGAKEQLKEAKDLVDITPDIIYTAAQFTDEDLSSVSEIEWPSLNSLIKNIQDYIQDPTVKKEFEKAARETAASYNVVEAEDTLKEYPYVWESKLRKKIRSLIESDIDEGGKGRWVSHANELLTKLGKTEIDGNKVKIVKSEPLGNANHVALVSWKSSEEGEGLGPNAYEVEIRNVKDARYPEKWKKFTKIKEGKQSTKKNILKESFWVTADSYTPQSENFEEYLNLRGAPGESQRKIVDYVDGMLVESGGIITYEIIKKIESGITKYQRSQYDEFKNDLDELYNELSKDGENKIVPMLAAWLTKLKNSNLKVKVERGSAFSY